MIYGVRTSLFLTSQRMPSRYNAFANVCNCKIFPRGMYLHWYFLFYNTHTNNSTQNHNSQFKIKHPYFTSIISFLIFILQSFTHSNHFKFKIKLFYIFFIILLKSFIKVLIFISYLCYNMVTKRLIV